MSVLTDLEESLLSVAKASLPKYLFQEDARAEEVLAAFAKLFSPIWEDLSLRIDDTFLLNARTEALYQHAKDRGTRPQENELEAALVYRLRFQREDSVTVSAIRTRVTDILAYYGVTIPAGYPGVVELRRDRAFLGGGLFDQITAVAPGLIAEGETFAIDGITYEFDTDASVTGGNVAVDISAAVTDVDVAIAMGNAIDAQYPEPLIIGTATVRIRGAGTVTEAVADPGFVVKHENSYLSRGHRVTGASRAGTVMVILLPFGTDAACAESVAEAVRQIKAGGVKLLVERRLSP